MSLGSSAFRLLLTGYLLAISICQESTTPTSLTSDATGTTTISLTTLLSNTSIRETTTLRPISAVPEFSIGTISTNSDPAHITTLVSQPTTVTVEATTSVPSAALQSTTINDRIATQITTPERHVNSTPETTTLPTVQVTSVPLLTSPHTTISAVQSTSAPITTQQGTATCLTSTQQETTTQSIPSQVSTSNNITDAVTQSSAPTASTLVKFGTSTSSPPGSIPSGSTSSSGSLTSQMVATSHTSMHLETSSLPSTLSRESELQEHRTTSFKMSTVTPSASTISENATMTDGTTYVFDNNTESDENRTESPSEKEKEEYLSLYSRNVTLIIVFMFILNIMSLSITVFIVSRIVKRSHRWDRPPSRCGSKRQYFLSKPPPPPSVASCTLISGRNLANDVECQDGESTRESVPVVTKDAGWCVPLSEENKKVNQDQRTEEDTGV